MNIRKVLCPVDLSEASGPAARYAGALAAHFSGALTLLHVAPAVDFDYAMAGPTARRLIEFTEHRNRTLTHTLDLFANENGLPDTPRTLVEGEAAEEIIRFARRETFDLIVMPTHGAGAIRRWLLVGSVATKVLQQSPCPVIVGTDFSDRDGPLRISRILCAVDLTPQTSRVLCAAAGLATELGATLTIAHAIPSLGDAAGDFGDTSWRRTLRTRLGERIAALQQETRAAGEVLIETGDPHNVVPAAARGMGADLVVVGSGAANGVVGRLRAHAYEIIRHSPCPVLTV
jgi:nucleotide-binding universal stress UspA family protein